jgi:UDP-N-acetylglucosamine pyrophosphorylase
MGCKSSKAKVIAGGAHPDMQHFFFETQEKRMDDKNFLTAFQPFENKMKAEGLSPEVMNAFKAAFYSLASGKGGIISEKDIQPAEDVPSLESVKNGLTGNTELLECTVMLKLNGGLGTSMGLDKAKSLLTVKDNLSFLDLIAKQVITSREKTKQEVSFMLMNSFSTCIDTKFALSKYETSLYGDYSKVEVVQNKVPKIDYGSMKPVSWPTKPQLEWCPPGHGDLYTVLAGSGTLDRLLKEGKKVLFVSNSDNLGATLDVDLLTYFYDSGKPFLMEVAGRTENDKKGGHLAVRTADGRLILRESAQCTGKDKAQFQDINKHKYFNTNNLWIRLDKLKEEVDKNGGFIPLPSIENCKTVDPQDAESTDVLQLETAMGAAIESFDGAGAVLVPRSRFLPMKKCNDLFLLRSDVYEITPDFTLALAQGVSAAPVVSLDEKHFKLVSQLEASLAATGGNAPSLKSCERLSVTGPVTFTAGTSFVGKVVIVNATGTPKDLPAREYKDETVNI